MSDSYVCSGAMMRCTMGTSPAKLTVLPVRTVNLTGPPMANISDHKSMVNLAPFGLCRSLGFPPTASATAAAHGHLTPMPCMHNTPAPWMGGKMDYLIKGQPALLKSCKCQCMWGGTISLITDGQVGEGVQWVMKKNKQQFTISQQTAEQDSTDEAADTSKDTEIRSRKDAIETFLKNNPQWFKNKYKSTDGSVIEGFQSLEKETNPKNNGSTNGYGTIKLSEEVLNNCIMAFQKIEKGETIEPDEAKSLSTLWHEINHNMHDYNKDGFVEKEDETTKQKIKEYVPLSKTQVKYMETANEFVSRKTLPEFYKSLSKDGDSTYKEVYEPLMSDRDNTGYNNWVRNYDAAIAKYKLDEKVVLEVVKKGLYETDYHKQIANLINGLVMGGRYIDEETHTVCYKISPMTAALVVYGL